MIHKISNTSTAQHCFQKRKNSRFTLIELLVVIAIIAILAGILMPALSSARARSRAVKCQSNLSQLGLVYNNYSDDNNGFIPCMDNLGGAGAVNSKGEPIDAKSWLNDTVKRYLGKNNASQEPVALLRCPDEEALEEITTNYGLNYLIATRGVGQGIKKESHRQPSSTAMIVENFGHLCYYPAVANETKAHNTGSSYGKNRAAYFRHNDRTGVAFIDGHIELREKMRVPCLESYPDQSAESLENTVFNMGKVDSSKSTIGGF